MKEEDREKFRDLMNRIGEPVPRSVIVSSLDQLEHAASVVGFPAIIRPAYTLEELVAELPTI